MNNVCFGCMYYIPPEKISVSDTHLDATSVCTKHGIKNVSWDFFCASHDPVEISEVKIHNSASFDKQVSLIHDKIQNTELSPYDDYTYYDLYDFTIPPKCYMVIPVPMHVRYRIRATTIDSLDFIEVNDISNRIYMETDIGLTMKEVY